jgi:hypothetical protein
MTRALRYAAALALDYCELMLTFAGACGLVMLIGWGV